MTVPSPRDTPMVATILVNYRNGSDTMGCIQSLMQMRQFPQWVVVVDNGSGNDDFDQLQRWVQVHVPPALLGQVLLLNSPENLGFAGGCNYGIRAVLQKAKPDYIWLLNNDTTVDEGCLHHLVTYAQCHPRMGVLGSALYEQKDPTRLQGLAGYVHPWHARPQHIMHLRDLHKISYIIGASFLITRSCYEACGLLDEAYFLYFEETDYCTRVQRYGFDLGVALESKVFHADGASSSRVVKEYFYTRNLLFYTWKWQRRRFLLSLWFVLTSRVLLRLHRADIPQKPIWVGIRDFFRGVRGVGSLPAILGRPKAH